MARTLLFDAGLHGNILFEDFDVGGFAVQSNQHMIIHDGEAMLLDPGGHKIFAKLLSEAFAALGGANLRYLFL